jgi:hypothetical protein
MASDITDIKAQISAIHAEVAAMKANITVLMATPPTTEAPTKPPVWGELCPHHSDAIATTNSPLGTPPPRPLSLLV